MCIYIYIYIYTHTYLYTHNTHTHIFIYLLCHTTCNITDVSALWNHCRLYWYIGSIFVSSTMQKKRTYEMYRALLGLPRLLLCAQSLYLDKTHSHIYTYAYTDMSTCESSCTHIVWVYVLHQHPLGSVITPGTIGPVCPTCRQTHVLSCPIMDDAMQYYRRYTVLIYNPSAT